MIASEGRIRLAVRRPPDGMLPDRLRHEYGFSALPPAFVRRAVVAGGAEYVKRAVIPLLPDRLRLVPRARRAAAA